MASKTATTSKASATSKAPAQPASPPKAKSNTAVIVGVLLVIVVIGAYLLLSSTATPQTAQAGTAANPYNPGLGYAGTGYYNINGQDVFISSQAQLSEALGGQTTIPQTSTVQSSTGGPTLNISNATIWYTQYETILASGNPISDTVELLVNGQVVDGPTAGPASGEFYGESSTLLYDFFANVTTPAGVYNITAVDLNTGRRSSGTITLSPVCKPGQCTSDITSGYCTWTGRYVYDYSNGRDDVRLYNIGVAGIATLPVGGYTSMPSWASVASGGGGYEFYHGTCGSWTRVDPAGDTFSGCIHDPGQPNSTTWSAYSYNESGAPDSLSDGIGLPGSAIRAVYTTDINYSVGPAYNISLNVYRNGTPDWSGYVGFNGPHPTIFGPNMTCS